MEISDQHIDNQPPGQEEGLRPLILDFLEGREGATCGSTSGTWGDVDASDTD